MIELQHLSAGYGGRAILKDVSLAFPTGQVTAILGPNGCGKSTLLKAIVGLADRQGGEILVENRPVCGYNSTTLAQKVSYLPQSRRVPEITAQRMVLHGRFPYLSYPRHYGKRDREIAQAAMEQVGIGDLAGEPLSKLSGGTRQKVYLAMALAQDTPTILLDEPTTYLDIAHQLQLMELCRELASRGKAVALVLHDLGLALQNADSVALIREGRLLAQGSPGAVYESGALEEAFGVKVHRISTPFGPQYFCQRRDSAE